MKNTDLLPLTISRFSGPPSHPTCLGNHDRRSLEQPLLSSPRRAPLKTETFLVYSDETGRCPSPATSPPPPAAFHHRSQNGMYLLLPLLIDRTARRKNKSLYLRKLFSMLTMSTPSRNDGVKTTVILKCRKRFSVLLPFFTAPDLDVHPVRSKRKDTIFLDCV